MNTCQCGAGYIGNGLLPPAGTECAADCTTVPGGACHPLATCTQPGTCICQSGYSGTGHLVADGCVPDCSMVGGCAAFAVCQQPNLCQCLNGYVGDGLLSGSGCFLSCAGVPGGSCADNAQCIGSYLALMLGVSATILLRVPFISCVTCPALPEFPA